MAEIKKVFKEKIPNMRFIGKKYGEFGHWDEFWANDWFGILEKTMGGPDAILNIWENGGGYVGLEHRSPESVFEYWIGMFTPAETSVPDGFEYKDFAGLSLGTCWIYGYEADIHDTSACRSEVVKNGMIIWKDENGGTWSFENCLCPRYTTPDENGKIILDYCYFVEK